MAGNGDVCGVEIKGQAISFGSPLGSGPHLVFRRRFSVVAINSHSISALRFTALLRRYPQDWEP